MTKSLSSIFILLTLTSCSTFRSNRPVSVCINKDSANNALKMMIPVLDTMSDTPVTNLKLEKDDCWKRTYSKNGRFLIMYMKNNPKEIILNTTNAMGNSSERKDCLESARRQLEKSDPAFSKLILNRNQSIEGDHFNDPEVGAVVWLKCDLPNSVTWNESVATFLHELNHGNKKNSSCLYSPFKEKDMCFESMAKLPLRSLAKLEKIPVTDKQSVAKLEMVQKVYLTDIDQPYNSILDELNSYTISMRTFNKLIRTNGKGALFEKNGQRSGVLVPLFQIFSVQYLLRLWQKDRELFQQVLLGHKSNWDQIHEVISTSESEYLEWIKTLKSIKKSEKPAEKELRAYYFKLRNEFNQAVKILNIKL